MTNIALLLPRESMYQQALDVLQQTNKQLPFVRVVETYEVVSVAREAIASGAEIVVARGVQAKLLKQNTSVTVVDIKLTAQELGLLVQKAKTFIKKKHPQIAFIGFENTFSSMTYFEELYQIQHRLYLAEDVEGLRHCVSQAIAEGADCIIGGDTVVAEAEQGGVPALFTDATGESIREALEIAEKAAYASQVERQSNARVKAILETSFHGILRTDDNGTITHVNPTLETLLDAGKKALVGSPLHQAIPEIQQEVWQDIVAGTQKELLETVVIQSTVLLMIAAPEYTEDSITGAVFSFQKSPAVSPVDPDKFRQMYLRGHTASAGFHHIHRQSPAMEHAITLAKQYAPSTSPVLLYANPGGEQRIFAESIHGISGRKKHPFVPINCFGLTSVEQVELLFGRPENGKADKSALELANYGTLYIENIDKLGQQAQVLLLELITHGVVNLTASDTIRFLDVRLIASSTMTLLHAVEEGKFLKELYYIITSLSLEIPPLGQQPEDILRLAEQYITQYAERYGKLISLSVGAKEVLSNYPWEGELVQLEHFCERLVLTCRKKQIEEGFVRELLAKSYLSLETHQGQQRAVVVRHPEAESIRKALEKNQGSRKDTAEALGISTTTLWRRMKKYNVE